MSNYKRHFSKLLVRLDEFRSRYIKQRNYLIVISVIVGALAALAAVILKISVQYVEHKAGQLNDLMHDNWLTAIFPLIGVGISLVLLRRIFKGRLTRGVGFIVDSIFTNKARLGKQHIFGHMLTSAFTVALGGSVGLEAPIVATGAAIGSNTAKDLRLSYKDTTLLLACGTASGIAAIFNSPIAGIVFALEVLMLDFSIPFFIPLLISTATATVVSQVLYPGKFVYLVISGWDLKAIPFYIVLGTLCGFVSVYATFIIENLEGYFDRKKLTWKTWLMGGIPLCLLIFMMPGLYGEGYFLITKLLHNNYNDLIAHSFLHGEAGKTWAIISMSVLLIGFKVISASLTTGAGGNGGIFAPSLVTGGLVGFVYAFAINKSGLYHLNTPNFIITAMAGVLAGIMHAPLTGIFLLAEITGGYTLFVPLMIVTALSYFITRKYVKHSIYHRSLVNKHILMPESEDELDHF